MQNPSFVNFTPSPNPLVQGYDFVLTLEDNTEIDSFHVDLAHLITNPDGTISYSTDNFHSVVVNFQNQNILCKVSAYGPNSAVSVQVASPVATFVFLEPPSNVVWLA